MFILKEMFFTEKSTLVAHSARFWQMPTFVTVHTFCVSGDTQVSYKWCLLILGYFCTV